MCFICRQRPTLKTVALQGIPQLFVATTELVKSVKGIQGALLLLILTGTEGGFCTGSTPLAQLVALPVDVTAMKMYLFGQTSS